MLLAFVPARAGSKGIPRKNLSIIDKQPLISYTIKAAQNSQSIDEIFISTDCEETRAYAKQMGLNVDYHRPPEYSGDTVSMIETIEHGLQWFEKFNGALPDEVILLQPSSPLRTSDDIDAAVNCFKESGRSFLVGVNVMTEHPYECIKQGDDQHDWNYLAQPHGQVDRRQDYLEKFYFINGSIYIAKTSELLMRRKFIVPGLTAIYVMDSVNGVDIDTPADLEVAKALFAMRAKKM